MKFLRKFKSLVLLLFSVVSLYFWVSFVNNAPFESEKGAIFVDLSDSDLVIDFLDVGKADCSLIYNKNILIVIDGGLKNSRISIVDYIKNNITIIKKNHNLSVDLMVLTHPHSDHYGQLSEIVNCFNVKRFITCKSGVDLFDHPGYENLLKRLNKKKINVEILKYKTNFNIDDIKIQILGPIKEDTKNINNNSVILKLIYKGKKILFMGDAEKNEEKDLLNSGQDLSADVLKLGHHGSNTSSTREFLCAVNPKYAVISAGKHYDKISIYPHKKVKERLKLLNIPYFVTKDSGNIRFAISEKGELRAPVRENWQEVA